MDDIRKAILEGCQQIFVEQQKKCQGQEEQSDTKQPVTAQNENKQHHPELQDQDLKGLLAQSNLSLLAQKILTQTNNPHKQTILESSDPQINIKSISNQLNKQNPIILDDESGNNDTQDQRPPANLTLIKQPPSTHAEGSQSDKNISQLHNIGLDSSDLPESIKKIDIPALIIKLKLDVVGDIKEWASSEDDNVVQEKKKMQFLKPQKTYVKIKKQFETSSLKYEDKTNGKSVSGKEPIKKINSGYSKELFEQVNSQIQKQINELEEEEVEENLRSSKLAKKGGKDVVAKQSKIKFSFGNLLKKAPLAVEPLDLGKASLQDVVTECFNRELLNDDIYSWFKKNYSDEKVTKFIVKFQQQKVQQSMFNDAKITIMDHRRMSEYLLKLYPKQYILNIPKNPKNKVQVFLKNLYELEAASYKKLCETVDQESKVTWWKQLEHTVRKKQQNILNSSKDKLQKSIKDHLDKDIDLGKKGVARKHSAVLVSKRSLGKVYNKNYELLSSELSSEENSFGQVKRKKIIR